MTQIGIDRLAKKLESSLGSGAVQSDPDQLGTYSIDGKPPALLCFPDGPEQIAVALRVCAEYEASVAPWGGGTAIQVGNVPRSVDVVIGVERLNSLVEHDHANLTATVQAGTRLSALQELLARHHQFLAVDAPFPNQATVGGAVAANLNGPRRMFYGGIRDLVTGMKMALITGEQIKGGGKVVKNVAGYDMCKLFVGSLGTLGVITEVTFKMFPIPECAATILAEGSLAQVLRLADDIARSTLLPAALEISSPGASGATTIAPGAWALALRSEGFEQTVKRHLRDAQDMAEKFGLSAAILEADAHNRLWEEMRDFPLKPDSIVFRISVPLQKLAETIEAVQNFEASEFHPGMVGDAGTGSLWISLDAEAVPGELFSKLVTLAQNAGGHAVLLAAPPAGKAGLDVWGPSPPGLPIMRKLKQQFDPKNLLNAGRFIAGL